MRPSPAETAALALREQVHAAVVAEVGLHPHDEGRGECLGQGVGPTEEEATALLVPVAREGLLERLQPDQQRGVPRVRSHCRFKNRGTDIIVVDLA